MLPGPSQVLAAGITRIKLGTFPEYSRLVFQFDQPVSSYQVQRPEVDELLVNFGPGNAPKKGIYGLSDGLVKGVAVSQDDGALIMRIKLNTSLFTFRHFTSSDKRTVIVDVRSGGPGAAPRSKAQAEAQKDGVYLTLPDPKIIAKNLRSSMPGQLEPGTDSSLFGQGLEFLAGGVLDSADIVLTSLSEKFPDSPYLDPGLYLLADIKYLKHQDELEKQFLIVTDAYNAALTTFPNSSQAGRGKLMLGIAYKKLNYSSEAIDYLKGIPEDHPDTLESLLAHLYMAEAHMDLADPESARLSLEYLLGFNPKTRNFMDTYFRLGRTFYDKGLYTRSNEIFKQVLKSDPEFYVKTPEILYFLGEGYYHSGRIESARNYLYHLLNIAPDYETIDTVLTRIGDTYRDQGNNRDAKKIFRLTKELYPNTTGSMISQLRLAEFGALRDSFDTEKIFFELEEGVWQATTKMYEKILAEQIESPLVQFTMFKIGLAAHWEKDYRRALKVFKDTLIRYPEGAIIPDVKFVMSQTILEQTRAYFKRKRYLDVVNYVNDNQFYISEAVLPDISIFLARSYLTLGMPRQALELFLSETSETIQAENRLLGLGKAYLKLERPDKAADNLNEFVKKFPKHKNIYLAQLYLGESNTQLGNKKTAVGNYEKAASAHPEYKKDEPFQSALGKLYLDTGQYKNAAATLENTVVLLSEKKESSHKLFMAHAQLAKAYEGLGQKKEAARSIDLALAIKLDAPFPEALYMISKTNFNLGLREQGMKVLKRITGSGQPFWVKIAARDIEARNLDLEVTTELKANQDLTP